MKKLVFILSLLIGIATNSFAYDFSAVCESGQTLYYTIISELYHRVIVDRDEEPSTSGDVILPMFVEHDGTTYTVYGIERYAFYSDTLLNSITLSDSIHYIGYAAFSRCYNLQRVEMGNNIRYIEGSAFFLCANLESIELPSTLFSIGQSAFKRSGLQSVSLPNGLMEIGEYMFSNCNSLQEVILPDSLTGISNYMFENCANLQRVEMPSYIEVIGPHAFENCSSLETIEIPNMLTELGSYAFSGCSSIVEIKLILNYRARVHSYAFHNCSNLKRVVIDVHDPFDTWSFIMGNEVFNGTELESITIKSQKVPEITENTFEGVSREIPIIVPCGLASQYENSENWSDFTNIQEDLLYSYNIVTEYDGMGTVQILHEPISCEDGMLEVLAIPQNGYGFFYWLVSDFVYVYWPNPINVEPFADGPIKAVFDVIGVEENNVMPIEVYPNPTDGVICIDVEGLEKIEVYSITGQFIKEFKNNEIDITNQDAGTYLLKVFTSSGWVAKQIIKE